MEELIAKYSEKTVLQVCLQYRYDHLPASQLITAYGDLHSNIMFDAVSRERVINNIQQQLQTVMKQEKTILTEIEYLLYRIPTELPPIDYLLGDIFRQALLQELLINSNAKKKFLSSFDLLDQAWENGILERLKNPAKFIPQREYYCFIEA